MGDIFRVNCPSCGEEKGPITAHPGTVSIHCSWGITATVDISAQKIDNGGSGRTDLSQLQRVQPGYRPDIDGESESDTLPGDDRPDE